MNGAMETQDPLPTAMLCPLSMKRGECAPCPTPLGFGSLSVGGYS